MLVVWIFRVEPLRPLIQCGDNLARWPTTQFDPCPISRAVFRFLEQFEQCGNGLRCIVELLRIEGRSNGGTITVESPAGLHHAQLKGRGVVAVDMGEPRFEPESLPFLPNVIGVEPGKLDERVRKVLPGYMTMGQTGMGDMGDMGMPVPPNSIPMLGGKGKHDTITMGGMFTILKVREGLKGYADPGWYDAPAGTLASAR